MSVLQAHAVASAADVRDAVSAVPDPELPTVTIGMLGMVFDVAVEGGTAIIDLLPTFTGCPATEFITADVRDAVLGLPGIRGVEVRMRMAPAWTADRITTEGREALKGFGIAPPQRERLPMLGIAGRSSPVCPYCGSANTQMTNGFGPTPCRAVHQCNACDNPFEGFKALGGCSAR
jgi:ring-1,2-phenylacetyl-CoA epoxidase subunit PaaD